MTKYELISEEVRKRILNQYYPENQPIPDENSLAAEFKCSRMTMKRALDILVAEGLLFRKRGHGTFIVKTVLNQGAVNVSGQENKGLTKVLADKKVSSQIIRFDVRFPKEEVAAHLSIDQSVPVYDILRLRLVEDEPYVLEKTFMPVNVISDIDEQVLQGSVYEYITNTLKLKIAGAHKKIRAAKSDGLDQIYLSCAASDPVLEVEQVAYLNTGIPFEYSFSRHRYDKFVFSTVEITKTGL
ncbi:MULTISPECIES: GntR family transcriptional regulator [Bacillus]|jgi:GntR family transcriptional regulator|uniref:GntR family transcriptional regulator n=1 Tax=Bacillus TaxID=1386 RepID=UPI0009330F24|nr:MULTISPECIES: GntR family transcriptional regulator [Bacillus]MDR0125130.1 GntR family transcriptional regulator [Bacillus zhangzhouensis]OJT61854.1 GntR family transcriptional regulator [Bacillus altitudinis]